MPTKEKSKQTATLKALYGQLTGDQVTHQRTIHAHYLHLDERRRRMIDARIAGHTYPEIGAAERIDPATARDAILRAVERIRKEVAKEPRYNHVGRRQAGEEVGSLAGHATADDGRKDIVVAGT
jgi:DNA-directed RNA polymerase specialized sigma24 family protein